MQESLGGIGKPVFHSARNPLIDSCPNLWYNHGRVAFPRKQIAQGRRFRQIVTQKAAVTAVEHNKEFAGWFFRIGTQEVPITAARRSHEIRLINPPVVNLVELEKIIRKVIRLRGQFGSCNKSSIKMGSF